MIAVVSGPWSLRRYGDRNENFVLVFGTESPKRQRGTATRCPSLALRAPGQGWGQGYQRRSLWLA